MLRRPRTWLPCAAALLACTTVHADIYTWTNDPANDHTGPATFSILALGYHFSDSTLDLLLRTNLPEGGGYGNTGYGNAQVYPGDLYVNVGGSRYSGLGHVYGLALTSHTGQTSNDPHEVGLPWPAVVQGHLYDHALFSSGSFENYPHAGPITGTPYDGGDDMFGQGNDYPAYIAGYSADKGFQAPVVWTSVSGQPWQYEVSASLQLDDLGIRPTDPFELWWSMGCGNDAVTASGSAEFIAVPEPGSLAMLAAGILALFGLQQRKGRNAAVLAGPV